MADAPAGGSGWGALEIILAIALAIGLISTITGSPIHSLFGTTASGTHASKTTSTSQSDSGCGVHIITPKQKQKIDTYVDVKGEINECLSDTAPVPDTLVVYVQDSKGTVLSEYTNLTVYKSFLGNPTFSGSIQLSGVAQSTSAYLIVTGNGIRTRVPLILNAVSPSSIITNTNTTTGAYFVPAPTSTNTTTTTTTNTSSGSGTGGAGGRAF